MVVLRAVGGALFVVARVYISPQQSPNDSLHYGEFLDILHETVICLALCYSMLPELTMLLGDWNMHVEHC